MASISDETEIAVRPNSPFVKENGQGIVKAGQTITLDIPKNFVSSTQSTVLSISKFPAMQYGAYLKNLVGYPYGCLEQTVSKAFPQLYFTDLAAAVAPEALRGNNSVYYVKEAIRKVESMQMFDGSLSYWPGGTYSNYWATVWGAHFLVEARKAGYDVNKTKLDNLLDYLHAKAMSKEEYEYYYYGENNRIVSKKLAFKENTYALYVLALAGRGDISLMNYYRARTYLLSNEMQYQLAGAYALMNNWSLYNSLMPQSYKAELAYRQTGDNFDSYIRANAIMLNVLMEVEPNNPQVLDISKYLLSQAKHFYTTQDWAWVFLGLGKAARTTAKANVTVTVEAGGKTLGTYDDKILTLKDKALNGQKVTLTATGSGEVYYFWNTEGVKVNVPVKEEDKNIAVRRTYYDRFGNRLAENTFKQGMVVVCKLSLESFNRNVENVAITDMIPSGFEIMNPRITATNTMSWIPEKRMTPENVDIRDDRLILFTSINAGKHQDYYYMLRVINQGEFELPPVGAEAMYDPDYHSYNGARRVKVIKNTDNDL
jgi:uncharacterized protein YfaS (alpha-2-macroglobulin family)